MSTQKVVKAIRPSACLIIVSPLTKRVQGYDYRVVLVRRNDKASFASASVFPGGLLEPIDQAGSSSSDPAAQMVGASTTAVDAATLAPNQPNAVDSPSLEAFKRCAFRETFEETGILNSTPPIDFSKSGSRKQARQSANKSASEFYKMLEKSKAKLPLDDLVYFSRWITPVMLPKRFDAHFFLHEVPSAQTLPARQDNSETLEISHFTPDEAIAAYRAGKIILFLPQLYILHDLALFKNRKDLFSAEVRNRSIKPFLPDMSKQKGYVVLPGDELSGGEQGARNRVAVEKIGNVIKPSLITRKHYPGMPDLDGKQMAESLSKL
jgi:nucleoside diphosphate-linked moiety X motif protein 19